jgi:hypothetical protein
MGTAPRELHPKRSNAGCRQLLRGRKLRRGWRTVFSGTPGFGGFGGHLRRGDSPLFLPEISGQPTTDGPRWRSKKSIWPQFLTQINDGILHYRSHTKHESLFARHYRPICALSRSDNHIAVLRFYSRQMIVDNSDANSRSITQAAEI